MLSTLKILVGRARQQEQNTLGGMGEDDQGEEKRRPRL